jgi:predicted TIM-barrel fold metal-dependent hydrolase
MIVDFHAYLGNWPPYQLGVNDAAGLIRLMDRNGVAVTFVSNVEGAFAFNPVEANERLARWVADYRARLVPVGTLNPSLRNWRADAQESIERWNLAGVRLHPSHQGYALNSDQVTALADWLAERRLPLFLATFIDEERFQHPAMRAAAVPVASIIELIRRALRTTIVLNNLFPEEVEMIWQATDLSLENVAMDVAALDKPFDGLQNILNRFGSARLVYGSQTPFLYPEATLALVRANGFAETDVNAILEHNWRNYPALARWVK